MPQRYSISSEFRGVQMSGRTPNKAKGGSGIKRLADDASPVPSDDESGSGSALAPHSSSTNKSASVITTKTAKLDDADYERMWLSNVYEKMPTSGFEDAENTVKVHYQALVELCRSKNLKELTMYELDMVTQLFKVAERYVHIDEKLKNRLLGLPSSNPNGRIEVSCRVRRRTCSISN